MLVLHEVRTKSNKGPVRFSELFQLVHAVGIVHILVEDRPKSTRPSDHYCQWLELVDDLPKGLLVFVFLEVQVDRLVNGLQGTQTMKWCTEGQIG